MVDPDLRKHQLRDAARYWLVIPATVIVSGKVIDFLFSLPLFSPSPFLTSFAIVLLLAGLVLIWLAMREMAVAGGTPNPRRPPKKIVTSGAYSICRHPMFLGYDLCALAVVLFFRSPGMLLISFPLFILLQVRFLRNEEKLLRRKFKQGYADYAGRTHFLLPCLPRKQLWQRQGKEK
jgi:protein-S-isoprenylcysteine O-methyltransferase Ste14